MLASYLAPNTITVTKVTTIIASAKIWKFANIYIFLTKHKSENKMNIGR